MIDGSLVGGFRVRCLCLSPLISVHPEQSEKVEDELSSSIRLLGWKQQEQGVIHGGQLFRVHSIS
jgi:hypothetical protein